MINRVSPRVDGGSLPAKAVVGEMVPVAATVFADGQPVLVARVRWRSLEPEAPSRWRTRILKRASDDSYSAEVEFSLLGAAEFQIEAWIDNFAGWRRGYRRWLLAKRDPSAELATGLRIVEELAPKLPGQAAHTLLRHVRQLRGGPHSGLERYLLSPQVARTMARALLATSAVATPPLPVWVERQRALFGSWYEMFPRSEGSEADKSGTFISASRRLRAIADMGFDVLYLPPIHPIGNTDRRGRNNAPRARPGDPGSPWAIGSAAGGHLAVHPNLGTLADFHAFQQEAKDLGLEVAMDYALQCSPDHPWVKEHPGWFEHRPDGGIRPAENPPKSYDDVFPLDFTCPDWRELWKSCYQILEFWIGQGVKAFRVDNPHTKPVAFWAWVFRQLRRDHPDVITLAEAFTRPALMEELSKVGFSQSYTYFTWRTTKVDLRTYMTHLCEESADYLRPNFFANTPDILSHELQLWGAPAFRYRLVLASTLSPSYGIYSGYELCENRPQSQGSEEYWNSEKYQFRPRDWDDTHSLAPLIRQLNGIRRQHPALQQLRRTHFHATDNPKVLAYSKSTADMSDVVLVVVSLDATRPQRANVRLAWRALVEHPPKRLELNELLSRKSCSWSGASWTVELDPKVGPALIYAVRPER